MSICKLRLIKVSIVIASLVAGLLIFPATSFAGFGIDPGKVQVDNLHPGAEAEYEIAVYNGGGASTSARGKKQKKGVSPLEELKRELKAEKGRSEEYLTRLKYMQADFENLKKRLDRQMEEVKRFSNERLVLALLEIVDELEAAIDSGSSSSSAKTIVQGVEMIFNKLRKVLESEKVTPIQCVGEVFDPSKHSAIAKVERDNGNENRILEEIRKGYMMKGKVIRSSIVKISQKPAATRPETE